VVSFWYDIIVLPSFIKLSCTLCMLATSYFWYTTTHINIIKTIIINIILKLILMVIMMMIL